MHGSDDQCVGATQLYKPKVMRQLERPGHRWKDNIKSVLKKYDLRV
jgi:hypothetical protein